MSLFIFFVSAGVLFEGAFSLQLHCVKSVQARSSVFSCIRTEYGSPNTGKYRPEKTPNLDTFHAVLSLTHAKLRLALLKFLA